MPPKPKTLNEARADWAQAAIEAFARETGLELDDDDGDYTAFKDLLCDLRHLAERKGLNFAELVSISWNMYLAEINEEKDLPA